jgi:hypothetical protein
VAYNINPSVAGVSCPCRRNQEEEEEEEEEGEEDEEDKEVKRRSC